MKKLSIIIVALLTFNITQAQQYLQGAQVWRFEDNSVIIRHQGVERQYLPADGTGDGSPPSPPVHPICKQNSYQNDLLPNTELHTVLINPSRVAGGTVYEVKLNQFFSVKNVQLKTLRGQVKIYSVLMVDKFNQQTNLTSLVTNRLCEEQGLTTNLTNSNPVVLKIKAEGFITSDVTLAVNIQYDNGQCEGCNSYGCWLKGGGCNSYGCYISGGNCNSYGCHVSGGGCNSYGCWYPGGSCNSYGCVKQAPTNAGKAPNRPPQCN